MSPEGEAMGASSFDGAAILSSLQSDLDPSKARTVAECLRLVFRSKQRPSPVVQALLSGLNPDLVRAAHRILLLDYFVEEGTSLSFMKRVTTTVWFVQLLLECRSIQNSIGSPISDAEAIKMVLALLQNLSKVVAAKLQAGDDEMTTTSDDGDEIDVNAFHAQSVACFAIGAYLRAINPYVSSLPFLLSPLWKGISDIAASLTRVPPELADETLRALLVYLREGESQTMTTLTNYVTSRRVVQQQAFQVKILIFLVARFSTLLRVHVASRQNSESSPVMGDVAAVLLQLRGLTLSARTQLQAQHPTSSLTKQDQLFLQAYEQLETKVEQCIVSSWMRPSGNSILNRNDLKLLLRIRHETQKTGKAEKQLISLSFAVGKALVFHRLLVRMMADINSSTDALRDSDRQSLLFICEELLFSTLPQAATIDPSLAVFSRCIDVISTATATCYANGPVDQRRRLDRLLIRWLAPSFDCNLHPLTRELLISLIQLHVLRLCRAHQTTRSGSPRSVNLKEPSEYAGCIPVKSLFSLLAKVLLDPRTQSAHRKNVAGIVMRFTDASGDAESLRQETNVKMQQAVAVELEKFIRNTEKAARRKQKRQYASCKVTDNNAHLSLGFYSNQDVDAVAEVLRRISTFDLPSLDRELSSLSRDLCDFDPSAKHKLYAIGYYSRNAFSMLVALLCGIADATDVKDKHSFPERFKQKTRLSLESVYSSLLKWLAKQQSRARSKTKGGQSLQTGHCSVIIACLLFFRSSFGHVGTGLDQLRICVKIVSDYAHAAGQVLQSASPSADEDERRCALSIVFATASLLAKITFAIPVSCPSDILQVSLLFQSFHEHYDADRLWTLQGIASIYKALFDTKSWPIESSCVTSLVHFASTIPSVHQSILPACIPINMQGLLQCRLQGLVFRGPGSHTVRSRQIQGLPFTSFFSLTVAFFQGGNGGGCPR
jgi:hypothetical protein